MTDLSDTEYAVLGLLTLGERSGYELDKLAQRSIGYFWRPAKSKIYAILPRLVARGLADVSPVVQEGRPDKQLYRITEEGETALRDWLDSRESISGVARDGLLLKLFFGGHADLDCSIASSSPSLSSASRRRSSSESTRRRTSFPI